MNIQSGTNRLIPLNLLFIFNFLYIPKATYWGYTGYIISAFSHLFYPEGIAAVLVHVYPRYNEARYNEATVLIMVKLVLLIKVLIGLTATVLAVVNLQQ